MCSLFASIVKKVSRCYLSPSLRQTLSKKPISQMKKLGLREWYFKVTQLVSGSQELRCCELPCSPPQVVLRKVSDVDRSFKVFAKWRIESDFRAFIIMLHCLRAGRVLLDTYLSEKECDSSLTTLSSVTGFSHTAGLFWLAEACPSFREWLLNQGIWKERWRVE